MATTGPYRGDMADIGKAPEGFPRRMQAARALAGLTIDQLADKLKDEPGLGERSLRNIENGSAPIQRSRQVAIMEACGLPPDFATADLWLLEAITHALEALPDKIREEDRDDVLVGRAFRLLELQPDDEMAATVQRLADYMHQMRVELQQQLDELKGEPENPGAVRDAVDAAVQAVAAEGSRRQSAPSATGRAGRARNR